MGCDAVQNITTWHRWRELLDIAHIIVIARPGWILPEEGVVADWLEAHRCSAPTQLHEQPKGLVHIEQLRPLAISSTEIRSLLQLGHSVRYLLPEPVLDYIDQHGLYRQKENPA
jgi:nicotinate-nucleotide adenylyltransferase